MNIWHGVTIICVHEMSWNMWWLDGCVYA